MTRKRVFVAPKRQVQGHTFAVRHAIQGTTQQGSNVYVEPDQRSTLVRIVGNVILRSLGSGLFGICALVYLPEGTAAQTFNNLLVSNPVYPNKPEDILGIWEISVSDRGQTNISYDIKAMRKMRKNDVIQFISLASASSLSVSIAGKMFRKLV